MFNLFDDLTKINVRILKTKTFENSLFAKR